jgi:hypothetical protein
MVIGQSPVQGVLGYLECKLQAVRCLVVPSGLLQAVELGLLELPLSPQFQDEPGDGALLALEVVVRGDVLVIRAVNDDV